MILFCLYHITSLYTFSYFTHNEYSVHYTVHILMNDFITFIDKKKECFVACLLKTFLCILYADYQMNIVLISGVYMYTFIMISIN